MSMEWFNRVASELQEQLESICEEYDKRGHMSINKASKHPRMEFFVETEEEEREYFFTLHFDPYNEEFYEESFDTVLHQPIRIMLDDITDIMEIIHESFHEFMEEDDADYYDLEEGYEVLDDEITLEEIDVEWETPEVTAFQIDDKIEVTYQFGIDSANGDGVLRRVNRIWTEDSEYFEDESNFSFKKEEGSTIIAMIASHLDQMVGYEEIINE
ncbi:hypothetical protein FG382_11895 [Psychrobacillus lasiicapitis]|uniref:Uncharacterized protein n=2 Tax=Psychrobacillus lasiicapitis TaxID=1636719 RepID=A0A544T772_9BACI|nr:hypothetical protein [Psychrobacillus lasiicapitis]TQR13297.1 hypothetical protein FG382_11895 [Psychrobacillus lasiicapitis]GGA33525.1 hypothetical protein GCM10011384_23980 [Psychrobacillus lasiicapitis]